MPQIRNDGGSGLLSTVFGVVAIILFVLFSAQLALGLYAKSVATAVAHDFARDVALVQPPPADPATSPKVLALQQDAQARLSGIHGHLQLVTTGDCAPQQVICVHLTASPPQLAGFASAVAIDRVIRVRVERIV